MAQVADGPAVNKGGVGDENQVPNQVLNQVPNQVPDQIPNQVPKSSPNQVPNPAQPPL